MRRFLFPILLAITFGCSRSGTWEDDPKNFERAFRQRPHEDAVIVRSWYWRSPHWTHEFAYFFHFRASENFQKFLFDNNKLKQPETPSERQMVAEFSHTKPTWFIPKHSDVYDVWIYADDPQSHFRIFIDKTTQDIFVADFSF